MKIELKDIIKLTDLSNKEKIRLAQELLEEVQLDLPAYNKRAKQDNEKLQKIIDDLNIIG